MTVWFRRYRMEFDLIRQAIPPNTELPDYEFVKWQSSLLEEHARVKYESFRDAADTAVFVSLSQEEGCRQLMRDITRRDGFIAEATWLARYRNPATGEIASVGTIQGLQPVSDEKVGAIQNIGVTIGHRGKGIGGLLIHRALQGFVAAGMETGTLEVTVRNPGALRLYQRIGFRIDRIVYKPGIYSPVSTTGW